MITLQELCSTPSKAENLEEFLAETSLTEGETAQVFGVSVNTLRRWRLLDQGPKYIKVGYTFRYRPRDLTAYLDSLR